MNHVYLGAHTTRIIICNDEKESPGFLRHHCLGEEGAVPGDTVTSVWYDSSNTTSTLSVCGNTVAILLVHCQCVVIQ